MRYKLKFKINIPFKGPHLITLNTPFGDSFTYEIIRELLDDNPEFVVKKHAVRARELDARPGTNSPFIMNLLWASFLIEALLINFTSFFEVQGFLFTSAGMYFYAPFLFLTIFTSIKNYRFIQERWLAQYYNELCEDYRNSPAGEGHRPVA